MERTSWRRRDFVRAAALSAGGVTGLSVLPGNAWAATSGPKVVAETWLSGRLLELTVDSPAMERVMKARLIVPRDWSREAERRWPVLYLFHGGSDDCTAWTRDTDIEALSEQYGVLVVMPDGGKAGGYTDWWYGGRGGAPRWETHHLVEIRGLLERRYRAGSRRAAAGLSTGGYGALAYSARHPGMFRYAAAYSGYAATLLPGIGQILWVGIPSTGLEPVDMWGPFDNTAVWRSHDPYSLAKRLRHTGLYVSCSMSGLPGPLDTLPFLDVTEMTIYYTLKPFAALLKSLRIPVTTHFYERGSHTWPYFQRELHNSWPMIMRALGAGPRRR